MSEGGNLPAVAESSRGVGAPKDWDTAVATAYLRTIGHTQRDAAKGAGVSERTIVYWEASDWWPDAVAEACDRWMKDLTAQSRRVLLEAVKSGDVHTARWVAERAIPELTPKAEVSGPGGGPVPVALAVKLIRPEDDDDADG